MMAVVMMRGGGWHLFLLIISIPLGRICLLLLLYSTVTTTALHCIALHCSAVQCSAMQYDAMLCNEVQCSAHICLVTTGWGQKLSDWDKGRGTTQPQHGYSLSVHSSAELNQSKVRQEGLQGPRGPIGPRGTPHPLSSAQV